MALHYLVPGLFTVEWDGHSFRIVHLHEKNDGSQNHLENMPEVDSELRMKWDEVSIGNSANCLDNFPANI